MSEPRYTLQTFEQQKTNAVLTPGAWKFSSDIFAVAKNKKLKIRLERPAQLTFDVPSDAPGVIDETGHALLSEGMVVVLARRGGDFSRRFTGKVWQVEDNGNADQAMSTIVCYDPLMALSKRLVRDSANNVATSVTFPADLARTTISSILTRTTNGAASYGGSAAAFLLGIPTATHGQVTFELRDCLSAIADIAEASGVSYYCRPSPADVSSWHTQGYAEFCVLGGDYNPQATTFVLSWGGVQSNVSEIKRGLDFAGMSNLLRVYGSPAASPRPQAIRNDAISQLAYGVFEEALVYGDLTIQAFIDSLANIAINVKKRPRELVSWLPQPDPTNSFADVVPWEDFDLGFLVTVYADPKLRGGFSGVQRVWGWDMDIDDDGVERVTAIYTGPDV